MLASKQIKLDQASEKLSDMAGLIKALGEAADDVAKLAPATWQELENKFPWFPEVSAQTAEAFGRASFNLQPQD